MKLYKLIANENQLKVIQDALESYTRLGLGQLEVVLSNLGFASYDQFKDNIQEFHNPKVKDAITFLKSKLFSSSYSLSDNVVDENFRVSYDLFTSIRAKITHGKDKLNSYTDEYKYSANGIIQIELVEDEKGN
jgi:hypothetical protein